MEIEQIEKIVDLMRDKCVQELNIEGLHLKLFDDYDSPPEYTDEEISKLAKANEVSDDEIMLNPYAGLEN